MHIPNIIAIDGPAASGKSTVAKTLAERLGYFYFDTGIMYRAATLAAMQAGIPIDHEEDVTRLVKRIHIDVKPASVNDGRQCDVFLDGRDVTWLIREHSVEQNVSPVSAYAGVRKALTRQQRMIGKRGKMVMAGRDIGTVVFPKAGLKLFLDASVEERAMRRHKENTARGEKSDYNSILANLVKRDKIDSQRKVAPLVPAKDAIIINTDKISVEQVVEKVLDLINSGCVSK